MLHVYYGDRIGLYSSYDDRTKNYWSNSSKAYPTIEQAIVDAYEQGRMYYAKGKVYMFSDVIIKEIKNA